MNNPFLPNIGPDNSLPRPANNPFLPPPNMATPAPAPAPEAPPASSLPRRVVGDPLVSLLKGGTEAAQGLVGLADIPTGGMAGKAVQNMGIDFEDTINRYNQLYTPEQQAANRAVQEAQGFLPTLSKVAQYPSVAGHTIIESLPSMIGGQAMGRGLTKVLPKMTPLAAGAAGEGLITAGSQAEQIRTQTDNGLLTPEQAALAAVTGGVTGAVTAGAGRVANKLGVGDINQALIPGGNVPVQPQGVLAKALNKNFATRAMGGGLAEAGQEAVQSGQEQAMQNIALDKPAGEGVGNAAAMGAVAGFGMGAPFSALETPNQPPPPPDAGPLERAAAKVQSPYVVGEPTHVTTDGIPVWQNSGAFFTQEGDAVDPNTVTPANQPIGTGEPIPVGTPGGAGVNEQPAAGANGGTGANQPGVEPQAEQAGGMPLDRRTDLDKRKNINDMSHEEAVHTLLHDDMTPLRSRRAYQEDPPTAHEASADLDDFKDINTRFDHTGGDDVISAIGNILHEEAQKHGINAYRIGGDEYRARGDDPEKLHAVFKAVQDRAAKEISMEALRDDGTVDVQNGIGLSYGVGKSFHEADRELSNDKQRRKEAGLRAGTRDKKADTQGVRGEAAAWDEIQGDLEQSQPAEAGQPETVAPPAGIDPDTGEILTPDAQAPQIDPETGEILSPEPQDAVKNAEINAKAHESPNSPLNDKKPATDAQIKAGNYEKPPINIHGLTFKTENPAGSERKGVDKNGKPWSVTMRHTYGYLRGTEDNTGEAVDAFLGDKPSSDRVFVVHQHDPDTKKYDEPKVMLNFSTKREAVDGYLANYAKGWKGFGGITEMSVDAFKEKLKKGEFKKKPRFKPDDVSPSVPHETDVSPASTQEPPSVDKTPKDKHITEDVYKKPENVDTTGATPQANLADLEAELAEVKAELKAQGVFKNAVTTGRRDKLLRLIADIKYPVESRFLPVSFLDEQAKHIHEMIANAPSGWQERPMGMIRELAKYLDKHISDRGYANTLTDKIIQAYIKATPKKPENLDTSEADEKPAIKQPSNKEPAPDKASAKKTPENDSSDEIKTDQEAADERAAIQAEDQAQGDEYDDSVPGFENKVKPGLQAPKDYVKNEPESTTEGKDNGAETNQSENVSTGGAKGGSESGQSRHNAGGKVDAGVAGEGEEPASNRPIHPGVSESDRAGTASGSGLSGSEASVSDREASTGGTEPVATLDDHEITGELGEGGEAVKFRNNIDAIKLIKQLEQENRHATLEERKLLEKYVGFGGFKGAFNPHSKDTNQKRYQELKALLTDEEFESAKASILNAHYTSKEIVNGIYDALQHLGFHGGRILEPSVGSGNFFGLMPKSIKNSSRLHGVELDNLTGRLVKQLYPNAVIAAPQNFSDYKVPSNYFDIALGNPPFGNTSMVDMENSPYSGFSIHNYFMAKMMDKVRSGGLVAAVISHNFLDVLNPKAKNWIASQGKFLGAVRLPNTAFKKNANTEVVTDIVFFQKGEADDPNASWLKTTDREFTNEKTGESKKVSINNYYLEHPENILGTESLAGSMYGPNEYTVEADNQPIAERIKAFIEGLPQGLYQPAESTIEELSAVDQVIPEGVKEGSYYLENGVIKQRTNDIAGMKQSKLFEPRNNGEKSRMEGMINLRDRLKKQLRLELDPMASALEIEDNRGKLSKAYDRYVKAFGYLNNPTNRRLFIDDTEAELLMALEFDYDAGVTKARAEAQGLEERAPSAVKADILSRRVAFPPSDVMQVESARDALLASLNAKGRVDMDYILNAYDKSEADILSELGDLVYEHPTDGLQTANEYLSGDVKTKLADAKTAAKTDSKFERNVAALEKVIPKDKLPSEIFAPIGGIWIPSEVYQDFLQEITGSGNSTVTYSPLTATWGVTKGGSIDKVKNESENGTTDIDAFGILERLLSGKPIEVKRTERYPDGTTRTFVLEKETEAAKAKADKVKDLWDKWLWQDGERSTELAALYNDKYNRTVNNAHNGEHLTLPGSNPDIKLRKHQKDGVWRAIQTRNILLDQVVGAGKTFEMVAIAKEFRRLGIAKKPFFAVPNHLTQQWRSEFLRLYPTAKIIAAEPADFEKDRRKRFFSKIATGDFDAVIVGHSSLKKITLSPEKEEYFYQEQLTEIAAAIEEMKNERGDRNIIRDMEKIKENLDNKIRAIRASMRNRDDVVYFDELGIDALFVDELHEFKNLFFTTQRQRVSGLGNPAGSAKAFDMFIKIRWLQDTFGEDAPLITATGTPVSNSLAEMYTMQRLMKYPEMRREGLHMFDAWASLFGQDEYLYEVAPSGVGYRISQRFSKFRNLPYLMSHYQSFADIITLQDLKDQSAEQGEKFPVPKIQGGKPTNVVAKRSPLQTKFYGVPKLRRDENGNVLFKINDLDKADVEQNDEGKWYVKIGDRLTGDPFETREDAELDLVNQALTPLTQIDPNTILGQFENLAQLTRDTKGRINALSLTGLANKASLDYRLIDRNAPDFPGSKINLAIDKMMEHYRKWDADKGTQLVFCDMSTPKSAQASAASKERRVYVLNDNGSMTHKKGTLALIEGYEGIPFFFVKNNSTKQIDIYEPLTGNKIAWNLEDRRDARKKLEEILGDDAKRDKLLTMREEGPQIDMAQILDYADSHDLEIDIDGENHFTPENLESLASNSSFSVYDDIKEKLVKKGVPENEIAFIHDYDTPSKKAELFKNVNRGTVRFLLGSTMKMGAGTNVQERLVALHHIDAPWRPSDLEQREGRIIRQKNKLYARDPDGFEVFIGRYATEQTYDTRRWQILEHKAAGIEQLRKYSGEAELEDVDGEAANSADMKAAASGNPLILEETTLRNDVKKLRLLQRAHQDEIYQMQREIRWNNGSLKDRLPRELGFFEGVEQAGKDNPMPADKKKIPELKIGKDTFTDKEAGIAALGDVVNDVHLARTSYGQSMRYRGIGFVLERSTVTDSVTLVAKYQGTDANIARWEMGENISESGLLTRMNNFIERADEHITSVKNEIAKLKKANADMAELIKKPFAQEQELQDKNAQHAVVQRKLMAATQLEAVPPEEQAQFKKLLKERQQALTEKGFKQAVKEARKDGGDESLNEASIEDEGIAPEEPARARPVKFERQPPLPGSIYFSKGASAQGMTAADIKAMLTPAQRKLVGSKIRIVQSDRPGAQGFFDKNGITLVADGLDETNLQGVLAHEAYHYARKHDASFQRRMRAIDAQFKLAFNDARHGKGTRTENNAYARVINAHTPPDAQLEEFQSYLIEAYEQNKGSLGERTMKMIRDLIAAIRLKLMEYGVNIKHFTVADLAAVARKQLKTVSTDTRNQGQFVNPMRSDQAKRFYSALKRMFVNAPDKIFGNGKQVAAWLDSNAAKFGVKADEIYWSGITDFLKSGDKIDRNYVLSFLDANGVQVKTSTLGKQQEEIYAQIQQAAEDAGYEVGGENFDGSPSYFNTEGEEVSFNELPDALQRKLNSLESQLNQATKYDRYTVPGGIEGTYRETLLTLPVNPDNAPLFKDWAKNKGYNIDDSVDRVKAVAEYQREYPPKSETQYQSSHWKQPNVLAHYRTDERTDAEGNKVLFVHEIQSDWGQEGKKKGFKKGITEPEKKELDDLVNKHEEAALMVKSGGVTSLSGEQLRKIMAFSKENPEAYERTNELAKKLKGQSDELQPAPFVTDTKSWVTLAVKHIISDAVDRGINKVAFVSGEQAADLFDLSRQVEQISWANLKDDDNALVTIHINYDKKHRFIVDRESGKVIKDVIGSYQFVGKNLEDIVGKEISQKITGEFSGSLAGNDLKVGGEGMKGFYNQIVPQALRDIAKRMGGMVDNSGIATDNRKDKPGNTVIIDNGTVIDEATGNELGTWDDDDDARSWAIAEGYDIKNHRVITGQRKQLTLTITPAMRDKVVNDGMPLFSKKPSIRDSQTANTSLGETISINGKPRPTRNSKGQLIHQTEEGIRNFYQWFGDSKVVDDQGRPLVVYHGTSKDFSQFDPKKIGNIDGGYYGWGFYFSQDRNLAGVYGNVLMPVYLALKNPLIVNTGIQGNALDEMRRHVTDTKYPRKVTQELLEKGYDGVLVKRGQDSHLGKKGEIIEAAIFDDSWDSERVDYDPAANKVTTTANTPKQPDANTKVKSAIGNTGTFSPESNDIRYSMAGQVAEKLQDYVKTHKTFNWLNKSINTQTYKATKDRHFKRVFDKSIAFEQDTAKYANEQADLAPSLLPKLDDLKSSFTELKVGIKRIEDAKQAGKRIFESTINDAPYTEQELVNLGHTPAQITMYKEFYAAVNKSLDDLALSEMTRMARALNLPPPVKNRDSIQHVASHYANQAKDPNDGKEFLDKANKIAKMKREGYAPLMRFGQYTVTVTDPEAGKGAPPVYFGMYETESEANKDAKILIDEYSDYKVTQGIMAQQQWSMFNGITPETMEIFANLMGVSQDEAFQNYLKLAVNNRSALKRLIHRKKVSGYTIDPQRVLATFLTSNARMTSKNLHLGEMINAIADIPKEKGDVIDEAVQLYQYVQNPGEAGAEIRTAMFNWYLGGSISSALVNMTQSFTTTLPKLVTLGNEASAAKNLTKAMYLASNIGAIKDQKLKDALKLAEEEGVVAPQELHMLYRTSMSRTASNKYFYWVPSFQNIWSAFFSLAEQYNRRVAFIAAYNMTKNHPTRGAIHRYEQAKQFVLDTQFQYSKSNRSNWARGTIGGAAFTFKTFTISYMEFLKNLPQKERAYALGILLLMAGLQGMPLYYLPIGADDMDDIIDTLGQLLGYNINAKDWKEKHINAFLLHGISAGIPIDISGRLSVGNLIPGTGLLKPSETDKTRDIMEFAGPAGSLAKSAIEAFDAAASRESLTGKLSGAAHAALPKALADLLKAADMWQTGQYRDYKGYKVVEATKGDAVWKSIGFQPEKVAERRRPQYAFKQYTQLTNKTETEIANLLAHGLVEGDRDLIKEGKAKWKDWNAKNPEMPIKITTAQVQERIKAMQLSSTQRLLKAAPKEMRRFGIETLQ